LNSAKYYSQFRKIAIFNAIYGKLPLAGTPTVFQNWIRNERAALKAALLREKENSCGCISSPAGALK
jgi:hypothetical protein